MTKEEIQKLFFKSETKIIKKLTKYYNSKGVEFNELHKESHLWAMREQFNTVVYPVIKEILRNKYEK